MLIDFTFRSLGEPTTKKANEPTLLPTQPESEPPRRVVGTCIQRRRQMALKESVVYEKQALIADMGLLHGRRFRVSWGPHWAMTQCIDSFHKIKGILYFHCTLCDQYL